MFSQQAEYIFRYIILPDILFISHLTASFFHFAVQNIKAFLVFVHFLFSFDFYVFWSISSIVKLCNLILPNVQYLSLIYCYIPFTVVDANDLNNLIIFPA